MKVGKILAVIIITPWPEVIILCVLWYCACLLCILCVSKPCFEITRVGILRVKAAANLLACQSLSELTTVT